MFLPDSVMMICAGNLCRSPFAAVYMQQRMRKAGIEFDVYSRGLLALPGRRPPEAAQQAAAEFDIDLSGHVAQPMLLHDVERAGLVLVMGPDQRKYVTSKRPASIGKVFLLSFASEPEENKTIEDPMGKNVDSFRDIYEEITSHVDAWIRRFGIKI